MTRLRRGGGVAAAFAVTAIATPAAAHAHGLVGKQDLPVPQWLFAWGAAVVLVASFVGLAALWQQPRLQRVVARPVLSVPRAAEMSPRSMIDRHPNHSRR